MRKNLSKIKNESKKKEQRRKLSIRKKVSGTAEKPRICFVKSNKHISVQVVDDVASKTLFSVQTYGKSAPVKKANLDTAKILGKSLADELKKRNLVCAVFDRAGKQYTGVVKTFADSIREHGIRI